MPGPGRNSFEGSIPEGAKFAGLMAEENQPRPEESPAERRDRFRRHLYRQLSWEDVDPIATEELIDRAVREDLEGKGFFLSAMRPGDPSSELFLGAYQYVSAVMVARESLVVAGLPMAPAILAKFHPELQATMLAEDGKCLSAGEPLLRVVGPARFLFTAERTLLNFIQMLSGVATETARLVRYLEGTSIRLLDTRKTHPGFRALIKYAVARGGGWNHRVGLFDRIMIKDNHLGLIGPLAGCKLAESITSAREKRPDLAVEVEVDSIGQLPAVLEAGPEVILLDNFEDEAIREALAIIGGRALVEISGKVTAERLPRLAALGADFISTGATVHQSRWVDIGLDLEKEG